MEEKKNLNENDLENTAGGKLGIVDIPQHSNFCPRCRSAKYHVVDVKGSIEKRVCDLCGFEYKYKRY